MKEYYFCVIKKYNEMKKFITFSAILTFILVTACGQQAQEEKNQFATGAKIEFEVKNHDFGEVPYKGEAIVNFEFKNTGDEPLILSNVKPSCGCTTPSWPKGEIKPGKSEVIKVQYRTTSRPGSFNKSITVYSNGSESPIVLRIKGVVQPAPVQENEAADKI